VKEFTMSMFATKEHLMQAKIAYYERILNDHRKIFTWIEQNPDCHPANIRREILRLLEELKD